MPGSVLQRDGEDVHDRVVEGLPRSVGVELLRIVAAGTDHVESPGIGDAGDGAQVVPDLLDGGDVGKDVGHGVGAAVGEIGPAVAHRFGAEQWQEAFDVARSGRCGKVILDWA